MRMPLADPAAMSIVDRIMVNPGSSWNELFEKHEFFTSYRTYVQVIASASSAELLKDWSVLEICDCRLTG